MERMFGRLTDKGNVVVLWEDDGWPVRRIDSDGIWPVNSELSSRYEHPDGIIVTIADAKKLGLAIDDDCVVEEKA